MLSLLTYFILYIYSQNNVPNQFSSYLHLLVGMCLASDRLVCSCDLRTRKLLLWMVNHRCLLKCWRCNIFIIVPLVFLLNPCIFFISHTTERVCLIFSPFCEMFQWLAHWNYRQPLCQTYCQCAPNYGDNGNGTCGRERRGETVPHF